MKKRIGTHSYCVLDCLFYRKVTTTDLFNTFLCLFTSVSSLSFLCLLQVVPFILISFPLCGRPFTFFCFIVRVCSFSALFLPPHNSDRKSNDFRSEMFFNKVRRVDKGNVFSITLASSARGGNGEMTKREKLKSGNSQKM